MREERERERSRIGGGGEEEEEKKGEGKRREKTSLLFLFSKILNLVIAIWKMYFRKHLKKGILPTFPFTSLFLKKKFPPLGLSNSGTKTQRELAS